LPAAGGLASRREERSKTQRFATIRNDSQRFATIRHDSEQFATIRNDSQRFATVPKSPTPSPVRTFGFLPLDFGDFACLWNCLSSLSCPIGRGRRDSRRRSSESRTRKRRPETPLSGLLPLFGFQAPLGPHPSSDARAASTLTGRGHVCARKRVTITTRNRPKPSPGREIVFFAFPAPRAKQRHVCARGRVARPSLARVPLRCRGQRTIFLPLALPVRLPISGLPGRPACPAYGQAGARQAQDRGHAGPRPRAASGVASIADLSYHHGWPRGSAGDAEGLRASAGAPRQRSTQTAHFARESSACASIGAIGKPYKTLFARENHARPH
jgi:hypothetical protein